ncbi:hypothetical protein B296_00046963 [Ensete ventricosum]|uniref:Uncharacterized protein n=1 Tax=Ensete ventricosum TaxID=4639 RepID=A0A426X0Z9_ENSVE|nr:hypothetical protein B296_00046963 [Ensete ventricosum]
MTLEAVHLQSPYRFLLSHHGDDLSIPPSLAWHRFSSFSHRDLSSTFLPPFSSSFRTGHETVCLDSAHIISGSGRNMLGWLRCLWVNPPRL